MIKNNKYRLYLFFSIALLVLLVAGSIAGFGFLRSLYETAMTINTIIIGIFLFSLGAVYRYLFLVARDILLFEKFTVWCEEPEESSFDVESIKKSILGSVLGAVSCSIQEHGVLVLNSSTDSRSIVSGYEDSFASRIHLISFLGGFLVLLGLMGTFFGLTITLQSMGEILSTLAGGLSDASDSSILQVMIQLIVQLKDPMRGMGTAFSTSLFGLAGSAFVGILSVVLRRMHDQLKDRLEDWLNEKTQFSSGSSAAGAAVGFPADAGNSSQLAAVSAQLVQQNEAILEALDTSNKYLLKMILLQQRSVEAMSVVKVQSTEATKEIGLGNELAGRLIKESRQITAALERTVESRDRDD